MLSNEVTTISIDTFQTLVTQMFDVFVKEDAIAEHPSVFLEGKPGVGKSQSIQTLAKTLEAQTGKHVEVTDIRLLLFNPIDLRGLPTINETKTAAVWLKPYIFDLRDDADTINILFLDELTAAPASVQAAAYQIVLDRRLGEHHLPGNTFVIAAGNGPKDAAISQPMPSALKNRFIHYKIEEDYTTWLDWAEDKIHPMILEFLAMYPHEFTSSSMHTQSNIIITPRSWEILSALLNRIPNDHAYLETLIASVVGERIAHKMLHEDTSLSSAIIEGKDYEVPSDIYAIHQVSEQLAFRIDEYMMDNEKASRVFQFLSEIPMDYAIDVFKVIMKYDVVGFDLESLEPYQSFIQKLEAHTNAH